MTTDQRPAWLWAADGPRLLWHNAAAQALEAGHRRQPVAPPRGPAAHISPIKGQLDRILKLGTLGLGSRARMRFLIDDRPVSLICACRAIEIGAARHGLLVVGVEPLADHGAAPNFDLEHLSAHADFALLDGEDTLISATSAAREAIESGAIDAFAPADGVFTTRSMPQGDRAVAVFPAGPDGSRLVVLAKPAEADLPAPAAAEPEAATESPDAPAEPGPAEPPVAIQDESAVETEQPPQPYGLSALVDRLATDDALYAPLEETDDARTDADPEPEGEPAPVPETSEALERASRYNFDELSRILNDWIGNDRAGAEFDAEGEPAGGATGGSLLTLTDETLVLNRLPVGILIFRDQDIVFANRALIDLTGYESVAALRALGLAAIFPVVSATAPAAGAVTHLVRQDGTHIGVSARLQSVSWQGRPALMLSAQAGDGPADTASLPRLAAAIAELHDDGFLTAGPSGVITDLDQRAATLLDGDRERIVGRQLSHFVAAHAHDRLTALLNVKPGDALAPLPSVTVEAGRPDIALTVFADIRDDLVVGYLAFLRPRPGRTPLPQDSTARGLSAGALRRVSRELRGPLNTIMGFAELIRTEAFGPIENSRYLEYARDIKAAALTITGLADEVDEFARLSDGSFALTPADIDLADLLEGCLMRVRGQASRGRVLLRSAISARLPHIRADAASLRQAVLNLLASAIDQSPEGGRVILSAQAEADGSVAIHVRDSSSDPAALPEHFVVFRDGQEKDGTMRMPMRSSIALTLTRSLIAVNACAFSVSPAAEAGTLMSLVIPASLVAAPHTPS